MAIYCDSGDPTPLSFYIQKNDLDGFQQAWKTHDSIYAKLLLLQESTAWKRKDFIDYIFIQLRKEKNPISFEFFQNYHISLPHLNKITIKWNQMIHAIQKQWTAFDEKICCQMVANQCFLDLQHHLKFKQYQHLEKDVHFLLDYLPQASLNPFKFKHLFENEEIWFQHADLIEALTAFVPIKNKKAWLDIWGEHMPFIQKKKLDQSIVDSSKIKTCKKRL